MPRTGKKRVSDLWKTDPEKAFSSRLSAAQIGEHVTVCMDFASCCGDDIIKI